MLLQVFCSVFQYVFVRTPFSVLVQVFSEPIFPWPTPWENCMRLIFTPPDDPGDGSRATKVFCSAKAGLCALDTGIAEDGSCGSAQGLVPRPDTNVTIRGAILEVDMGNFVEHGIRVRFLPDGTDNGTRKLRVQKLFKHFASASNQAQYNIFRDLSAK